jgi:hypothetical protein
MPKSVPFLDCCKQPALDDIKCWVSTECVTVSLRVCRNCNSHWYYHLKEYCISSPEYDRRAWYVRLTPEEAEKLAQSPEPPPLSLFEDRDGIARGEEGIQKIRGVPSFIE